MIPIDIKLWRSNVKIKGQGYSESQFVGEGDYMCFTNISFYVKDGKNVDKLIALITWL